jgi:hypothetical protein
MLIIQVVIFLSIVLLALWLERRSEPKKATKQQAADKGEWISRWDRISRQAAIADAVERKRKQDAIDREFQKINRARARAETLSTVVGFVVGLVFWAAGLAVLVLFVRWVWFW